MEKLKTASEPSTRKTKYSQAEINNRAMGLYLERYEMHPNEMGTLNRQATRFYAECLKQASDEMGPAIEFNGGGEMTHAQVNPEVQALIDRLALLKASPIERAKLIHFRS